MDWYKAAYEALRSWAVASAPSLSVSVMPQTEEAEAAGGVEEEEEEEADEEEEEEEEEEEDDDEKEEEVWERSDH